MFIVKFLIYLIFITYLNWSLGAYRAIHESTGQKGLDVLKGIVQSDSTVLQAQFPWTVDLTFTSLILVFVGIGFAIASYQYIETPLRKDNWFRKRWKTLIVGGGVIITISSLLITLPKS